MTRRELLGTLVGAATLSVTELGAAPLRVGVHVYLYGRVEVAGPVLAAALLNGGLVPGLRTEAKALAIDFCAAVARYQRRDWQENEQLVHSMPFNTVENAALEAELCGPTMGQVGMIPFAAGWMDKDGEVFWRRSGNDAYEGIFYVYGRLRLGHYGITPVLLDTAFCRTYVDDFVTKVATRYGSKAS